MRRPSASVLTTSMDLPFRARTMSPGFWAPPPGMFSVAGTRGGTVVRGLGWGVGAAGAAAGGGALPPLLHLFSLEARTLQAALGGDGPCPFRHVGGRQVV